MSDMCVCVCGPGSSVGIATDYWLDVRGSNSGGARFSALVQTGPGAHPASCTMGTGSLLGVENGGGVTLTSHLLLAPSSWKSTAIPLSHTLGHNRACNGNTTFLLYVYIQGVTGGTDQTSGECSLGHTTPI